MIVSVFGMGHVGLITAVMLGRFFDVICVEIDEEKLIRLRGGEVIFYEPGFDQTFNKVRDKLEFTDDASYAINTSDISFIAVGTPTKTDHSQDHSYLASVLQSIGEALKEKDSRHLVVIKSTILPGTSENLVIPILEHSSGKKHGEGFSVLINPEFSREGEALHDLQTPDKIVIGAHDFSTMNDFEEILKMVYVKNNVPLIKTNYVNAEMIKYAQNAFLATKISFINTIANMCEKIPSADVEIISKALGLDHRISSHFLRAGLGYGGSCLPKDIEVLSNLGRKIGYEPTLLDVVALVNEHQPQRVVTTAEEHLGSLLDQVVSLLGLAFKPGTDDIREAPSLRVIESLLEKGAKVRVYDPKALSKVENIFGNLIEYYKSTEDCLDGSDCCILVTEWDEFRSLKPDIFLKMKTPFVIDGRRGISHISKVVEYHAVGLGKESQTLW